MSALRLEDDELLIVISDSSPSTAIADYARRWGIEINQPQYIDKDKVLQLSYHWN